MTLTPKEYKGHTSDSRSPNMCGFLALGKPGSKPPGPVPTQTTVSLNTVQANATFWHFSATGEYPLSLKPLHWDLYTTSSNAFTSSLPSWNKFLPVSLAQNKREILMWYLMLPRHLPKSRYLDNCWMPTEILAISTPGCFQEKSFGQF